MKLSAKRELIQLLINGQRDPNSSNDIQLFDALRTLESMRTQLTLTGVRHKANSEMAFHTSQSQYPCFSIECNSHFNMSIK